MDRKNNTQKKTDINEKKHIKEKKLNNGTEIRINNLRQLKEDLLQEKEETVSNPLIKKKKK